MASSSSTSNFNSASNSHSWNYEVFISFRGEDTRKGFVDHLYTALVQQGIQTYKDDKTLPRGATIGSALFKAIQESRIAVVVFSKNYADSSWCLDELAHIIECMDSKEQIVMPVFYDVDPSDVRKQNGKYGEAITKHERDNKQKVDLWRNALLKAGNLSGWVPKDFANGHEASCVKDIVATISHRLSSLITNVSKDFIGLETRLQDLKSKLKIGSGGVCIVGIWGVGGGGKTTLASAAYMEISHQFEACCLIENIREESSKIGLTKLQEKLLSLVTKTTELTGSETEGISMIKRKLGCKRVLVVLDDVNEHKQLEVLAGSHDWFGEGSRIIITTRDEHLLTRKADTIYEVSLLSHDEAIKLFSKHAFGKYKLVEDYEKLSRDVVSYAGGLPLALEVLGSFLYDKDKDEWISILAKLKHIPYPEVTKRLKISYDGLEPDEKQLFLDIACFYRRVKIDEAMQVLPTCNFQPRIGIKVLAQKSLIKVSDGIFDMHDLVEEMAHYIVRGEYPNNANPEKHSRIWKMKDIDNLCARGAAAPSMVRLTSQKNLFYVCVSIDETEVLALRDPSFRLTMGIPNHQYLPDVIANMKKLRWIDWKYYPASSLLPETSQLKQLWKRCESLPSLKILDLHDSRQLRRTPDFNGLPCLERLNLEKCVRLKEIHPSIGYHQRLVWVNMKGCLNLKSFPPIIHMKKLETLVLSECRQLKKFPDIQTRMDSLENLHLDETGIKVVPPSVGQFCTNLVFFDLRKCSNLKWIEGNFHLLKRLKYLKFYGLRLEKSPGDLFNEECRLEELSLTMTQKLPQFPHFLRKLDISYCKLGDGDMPYDMSGLINLQILDLSHNRFSRLHSSLSKIPCLKFLKLSFCESLIELPDLPSSIAILIAEFCDSLQSVGDLSIFKCLWKVSLYRHKDNKLIGVERVLHSMLQNHALEDRFMSIVHPCVYPLDSCREIITMITLQLPQNWYNDFSGFLLSADACNMYGCNIVIKQEMLSMDSQPDHNHWEEYKKYPESYTDWPRVVGYVPFGSLRHTSWWNTTYTHITFHFHGLDNLKVGLVPRLSKSKERAIDYSECWDETGIKKTFKIEDASKPFEIKIEWSPEILYFF
ncbi:TMV resistance protein N-like [Bidens hawaiensis]|uniref:TMV resistance protein N-like n=1 Tax=Bidens hawaiensis TaxID=980011 RepID=UPI00404AB1DA